MRRYASDGALDAVVEVDARNVTACAGPGLDELFITTSRQGLTPGEDPLAGALFHARVPTRGQRTRAFHE